jgi:drug/metabolite transporter (DMT)-like permease
LNLESHTDQDGRIRVEPGSGTLLTFVQFLFVALTGYISQFDKTRPPFFIKRNEVPISRWLVNIVLFFSINVLNNHAFSYDISVPVHIILRSGGPITTLVAGWLRGKNYPQGQVLAVVIMTVGVATAAWSDSQSKVGVSSVVGNGMGQVFGFSSDCVTCRVKPFQEADTRGHRLRLASPFFLRP